jgi:hypothetical protein
MSLVSLLAWVNGCCLPTAVWYGNKKLFKIVKLEVWPDGTVRFCYATLCSSKSTSKTTKTYDRIAQLVPIARHKLSLFLANGERIPFDAFFSPAVFFWPTDASAITSWMSSKRRTYQRGLD